MIQNQDTYKKILEKEKTRLEKELGTIAHHKGEKTDGAENWEAVGTIVDESIDADPNEVADKIEEFETNQAITGSLKMELDDVNMALAKMEAGTYGNCEECGKEIEDNRLDANPAAKTCIEHVM